MNRQPDTSFQRLVLLPVASSALLGLIILSVFLRFPGRVSAVAAPISEREFWTMFADTRSVVSGLGELGREEACQAAQAEAEKWSDVESVRLDSGTVVPVRADWLTAGLRECPPDAELLLARMDAFLDNLSFTYNPEDSMREDSPTFDDGSLREILSRKEFQVPRENAPAGDPVQHWLESLMMWLRDLADRLGRPQGFVFLIGLTATCLLLAVLFLAFRLFRRNIVPSVEIGSPDAPSGIMTSGRALELAQQRSAAGNTRLAVRYLYLAALLSLEEQGHITTNRSFTDQEYIRSLAHLPQVADLLRRLVDVFDRVWYGFQTPTEREIREYEQTVTEIRRRP